MTSKNYILKQNKLAYYWMINRTMKNSNDGKRHSICDCHIINDIKLNKYYIINPSTF